MDDESQLNNSPILSESLPIFSHIFTPGSSLHPTFLRIVDGVFILLILILISLLVITAGNLHFVALIVISLALWGSVKWFVNELQQEILKSGVQGQGQQHDASESRKDK